jgi:hypothetical protein
VSPEIKIERAFNISITKWALYEQRLSATATFDYTAELKQATLRDQQEASLTGRLGLPDVERQGT